MKKSWNLDACYAVLGVPKTATERQIKSAYRKMVLKHHPDKSKEKDVVIKFQILTLAYNTILENTKQPKGKTGLRDTSQFEKDLHDGKYKDFDKKHPGMYPGYAAGHVIDMGNSGYFDEDGFYHGHKYEKKEVTLSQVLQATTFKIGQLKSGKNKKMKRKKGR